MAVNVTEVPAQIGPEGEAMMLTVGVALGDTVIVAGLPEKPELRVQFASVICTRV